MNNKNNKIGTTKMVKIGILRKIVNRRIEL